MAIKGKKKGEEKRAMKISKLERARRNNNRMRNVVCGNNKMR